MFGMIKKAMTVGAVVAVGALAGPALASADMWSPSGPQTIAGGELGITIPATGTTVRCHDVTSDPGDLVLDASNPGSPASGVLGSLNFNGCSVVGMSACVVGFATGPLPWPGYASWPGSLPWQVQGAASTQRVTLGGVSFVVRFSGSGCPVSGVTIVFEGSVTGDYGPGGELSFVSEPGISAVAPSLGAVSVTGLLYLEDSPLLLPS